MYCLILYSFGVLRHTYTTHRKASCPEALFSFLLFLLSILSPRRRPHTFSLCNNVVGDFYQACFCSPRHFIDFGRSCQEKARKILCHRKNLETFSGLVKMNRIQKNNKPSKVWWWCNAALKFFWFCRFSKLQKGHFLSLMSSRCYSIIKAAAEELHWRCCCGRLLHFFNRISDQRRWTFWFDCLSFTNKTKKAFSLWTRYVSLARLRFLSPGDRPTGRHTAAHAWHAVPAVRLSKT